MIFNDFRFIFIFLPLVLTFFYLFRGVNRRILLIVTSIAFYGLSGVDHALILILGIMWVYCSTKSDSIKGNIPRLLLAISFPLASLCYYKYANFILDTLQLSLWTKNNRFNIFDNILLPAGISFFTFQLISFAVDRYRGRIVKAQDLSAFALYISFFPQLVAGPILRFDQVIKPIKALTIFKLQKKDLYSAISYICFGLFAKIVIADGLSEFISPMIEKLYNLSTISCAYIVFAYSFQIYFDFYGYSLVAIGLGRLFGFHYPDNFKRPYMSRNLQEFWKRWHITLSFWIRDYLYIPLGGNHNYTRNIIIVFAICGLWHGAGWNFVVWGLYHAFFVVAYSKFSSFWDNIPIFIQRAINFTIVSFGWILFLFDFDSARIFLKRLVGFGAVGLSEPGLKMWAALAGAGLVCFWVDFEKLSEGFHRKGAASMAYSVTLSIILFITFLFVESSKTFIYFRF